MPRLSSSFLWTPCALVLVAGCVSGWVACSPNMPAREPTTVLVVRHAEKVSEASDAVLSEAGWNRARELQRVTADAGVSVLFASQHLRAQQTLEPISDQLGLEIQVHDASDPEGLAARILTGYRGQVVLVSGHSNTVPGIVAALGAPEPAPIDDGGYDNLYVVSVHSGGQPATVLHLHYGLPAGAP